VDRKQKCADECFRAREKGHTVFVLNTDEGRSKSLFRREYRSASQALADAALLLACPFLLDVFVLFTFLFHSSLEESFFCTRLSPVLGVFIQEILNSKLLTTGIENSFQGG